MNAMLKWLEKKMTAYHAAQKAQTIQLEPELIDTSLMENMVKLQGKFDQTSDLEVRQFESGKHKFASVAIDNMFKKEMLARAVVEQVLKAKDLPPNPDDAFAMVRDSLVEPTEVTQTGEWEEALGLLMSGFTLLFMEGSDKALAFGLQGYEMRGISEPVSEVMERGSREGLVEVLRVNMSMIRRRLKTTKLKFEVMTIGRESNTDVALCYLRDTVSPKILREVKRRLQAIELDTVLESGYLQPFLEAKPFSLFSSVGVTERPDTICAKISEGRIAVLVDGTPFALVVPYLFSEHFQSLDDYANRPYFATLIRLIKYISFLISILLPGLYVGLGEFNPEIFPPAILYKIFDAENATPFPLMMEALIIHFIYEIMREAGLRLPRPVGHAVSIVGALVIGESAVSAGLIGAPMVMIVAITAISSFVVPSLYNPVAVLRFLFIFVGGFAGVYGVVLLGMVILIDLCSLNTFGIPYMSPISPFDFGAMRDTFVRLSWKVLGKKTVKVQNLHGTDETDRFQNGEEDE